jgi:mono/diheme cytochrome c family protein
MRAARTTLQLLAAPRAAALLLLTVSMTTVCWPASAQDSPPIWAGVYTEGQAERGRLVVQNHCSECHHEDLSGGEGPALMGPTFMVKWETHSLERLFNKIRDTMPSVGSSEVTEREKLDAVAFILQQNGFPAGSSELTDAAGALGSLTLVPKGGPAPPRAGALVRAIGCLTETGAGQWVLTQSTEPQVTTLGPLTTAEKQSIAEAALGSETIQLLSVFPSPTALKGHKALAKGLFIKTASDVRINVMSLESIAAECGK